LLNGKTATGKWLTSGKWWIHGWDSGFDETYKLLVSILIRFTTNPKPIYRKEIVLDGLKVMYCINTTIIQYGDDLTARDSTTSSCWGQTGQQSTERNLARQCRQKISASIKPLCGWYEQNYHFQVLRALWKKWLRMADGLITFLTEWSNFRRGRMKSREGTVVDADDLIVRWKRLHEA
jgi:hypothetical protein